MSAVRRRFPIVLIAWTIGLLVPTAALTAAPTTDSAKLTTLLPLLS